MLSGRNDDWRRKVTRYDRGANLLTAACCRGAVVLERLSGLNLAADRGKVPWLVIDPG